MGLFHHTDVDPEWAYDHTPSFGRPHIALDEAGAKARNVAEMKNDWKFVFHSR
jgi:hypothetical protein